jgi:rod shape-determining protein MreD
MTRLNKTLFIQVPLILVLFLLQTSLFRVMGLVEAKPNLLLVLTIAWALQAGAEEGLLCAFISGLMLDLLSPALFGINTLSLILAAFLSFPWVGRLIAAPMILPLILTPLITAVQVVVSLLFLSISGHSMEWALILSNHLPLMMLENLAVMVIIFPLLAIINKKINITSEIRI